MDANIRAALDAQSAKIDDLTTAIVTEIDEVKAIIAGIPSAGDPAEIVSAINAANTKLDQLKAGVEGISDAVKPTDPA